MFCVYWKMRFMLKPKMWYSWITEQVQIFKNYSFQFIFITNTNNDCGEPGMWSEFAKKEDTSNTHQWWECLVHLRSGTLKGTSYEIISRCFRLRNEYCVFLQGSGNDWDNTVDDVLCGLFSVRSRRRLHSRRLGPLWACIRASADQ